MTTRGARKYLIFFFSFVQHLRAATYEEIVKTCEQRRSIEMLTGSGYDEGDVEGPEIEKRKNV